MSHLYAYMLIGPSAVVCVQLLGSRLEMSSFAALFVLLVATNVVVLASALKCYECGDCPDPFDKSKASTCSSVVSGVGGGDMMTPPPGFDRLTLSDSDTRRAAGDDFVCSKNVLKADAAIVEMSSGTLCFCI